MKSLKLGLSGSGKTALAYVGVLNFSIKPASTLPTSLEQAWGAWCPPHMRRAFFQLKWMVKD